MMIEQASTFREVGTGGKSMPDSARSNCEGVTEDIRAVCDASPIPVAIVDEDKVCYANAAYESVVSDTGVVPTRPNIMIGLPPKGVGSDRFYDMTTLGYVGFIPNGSSDTDRHFRWSDASLWRPGLRLLMLQDVTAEFRMQALVEESWAAGQRLIDGVVRTSKTDDAHVHEIAYEIVQRENGLGGDFFFARAREGGKQVLLVVGDSSGKGLKGAITTAIFGTLLRQVMRKNVFGRSDPAIKIIKFIDQEFYRIVHRKERSDMGCDAAVCYFDLVKRKLYYSSGNFPLYRQRAGKWSPVEELRHTSGKSIGYAGGQGQFGHYQHDIENGDVFVAVSDGVFEARGKPSSHGELGPEYGTQRFLAALRGLGNETEPARIKDALYKDLCAFDHLYQTTGRHDDDVLILAYAPRFETKKMS